MEVVVANGLQFNVQQAQQMPLFDPGQRLQDFTPTQVRYRWLNLDIL